MSENIVPVMRDGGTFCPHCGTDLARPDALIVLLQTTGRAIIFEGAPMAWSDEATPTYARTTCAACKGGVRMASHFLAPGLFGVAKKQSVHEQEEER